MHFVEELSEGLLYFSHSRTEVDIHPQVYMSDCAVRKALSSLQWERRIFTFNRMGF